MAKRPSARWTGTLRVPELDMQVEAGLYSSARKVARQLPFVQVHTQCLTPLEEAKPAEKVKAEALEPAEKTAAPVQTTREIFCPRCSRALRASELTSAVQTENLGMIVVSDEERASLKAKKVKEVALSLRRDPSQVLAVIGIGRRFYVMPKPQSTDAYYCLMRVLEESERVGFIPELLIDKRSYVLIVRPVITPQPVFGHATQVLVADELADTETVTDPRELQLLPDQSPDISAQLKELSVKAKAADRPISLAECISPERQRFDQLIAAKIAAKRDIRTF